MKSEFAECTVLSSLLGGAGIKLVDIGGRGSALSALAPLASFADYYASEPDRAEAERLTRQLPLEAPWRTVTVLSEAIASRRGEAQLYLTNQPGMSSLLEPDPAVTGHFYLSGKFEVMGTTTVPTVPLDEAASHYGFADACFLKVDTQGTELDILQSGSRLVRRSLLAVYVECSFRAFYRNQALFGDVDGYLRDNGFTLFSLSRTNLRRAGYRASLHSTRVTTWAHCLYFREPETLVNADDAAAGRDVARLLGLALAFRHHDLAFEIVSILRRLRLLADSDLDRLEDELERIAASRTRRIIRKAEQHDLKNAVMAPAFRDRRQVE